MEGSMGESANKKAAGLVSINLTDTHAVIEIIPSKDGGNEKIRFTLINKKQQIVQPFELEELDLVLLLQKAIKAGILSPDFVKNLGAEFEI
jgi:hypothetical protein